MNALLLPLLAAIGPWAVLVMAVIVFAETGLLAAFLPGDSLLFTAGILVTTGLVHLPLALVVALVALAAFLGDQTGYTLGHRFGPRLLNRSRSRFLSPHHVTRAETFFARHGSRAVVLARFVPVARTFTPVIAGIGSMERRTFVFFNALGALGWAATFLVAGALLGGVPLIADHVELVAIALVALSLVPVAIGARSRRRRGSDISTARAV
ncbi:DedA family protein [Nocardioides daeguensis]|uniref:VTT domain-containing protein n=1 Tax=Nocardioides daeguensis TaxID=908359 RepID=A0ABP6W9H2_9ACTN|nr:VTT domain-containing protein [Nocardioides daeguensis]MBV6729834.1 VTT domain-containing protein [Nocardioides daeguensis]MCR1774338.1 VTT domain-containing protein [Nocardioides daeguensis]